MDGTVVTWAVSHVDPTTSFIAGTTMPTEGFNVHWTTNTGLSGSVFVAKAQINDPNAVAAAVANQVSAVVTIHNLSGEHAL